MVLFLSLIFFALTAAALLVVIVVDGAAVVVVVAVVVDLVVVAVVVGVVIVVVEEDTNGLGATVEMSLMTALAWPRSESEANWSSSSSSSKLPFLLRTEEEVGGRTCFGLCTLVNGRVCRRNIFDLIEASRCAMFF